MRNKLLKCGYGIFSTVIFGLYIFVLYELVMIPAVLDWSAFGVILIVALAVLLFFSVPAQRRRAAAVLAFTFLLTVRAIANIRDYPSLKFAAATFFIFIFLLIIGKLLGRVSVRRYFTLFLVALIIGTSVDLAEVRFWPEFTVKWESPLLYKKLATVDYFPTVVANVDEDSAEEIITQQNIPAALKEQEERLEKGPGHSILEKESNTFAVYKWNGSTFMELPPGKYSMDKFKSALPADYLGYPFYQTSLVAREGRIGQDMNPVFDRAELMERLTRFGSFPFQMLAMDYQALAAKLNSQRRLDVQPPAPAVLTGDIITGPPRETVSIEESLKVWGNGYGESEIGEISPAQIPDIGTGEIVLGDVDGDGTDEVLLTSSSGARILKMEADNQWQTLWVSPEASDPKYRFQGFRFEDFAPLGKSKTPQIIALSKSNVRANPTRYMTGYTYENGVLEQQWRVFSGLINLRAGDVDGDGENELIGYMYRQQRIYVLEKHNLPVVPALYLLTALLTVTGIGRQLMHRNKRTGGEQIA